MTEANGERLMKERSLVAFTLLAQLVTGAFWMLGIVHVWASGRVGAETAAELTAGGFLALVPVMAAALLISLLHLGTPRNAWRAAANLRTSWLSREIVFTLLFGLLLAVFAGLHWRQTGDGWMRLLVGLAAGLAGGLALYSMTRLYMLRTIPSWNTWMTPAAFGISTLLLGGLAAGVWLACNPVASGELLRLPILGISLLAILLLSVQVALAALRRAAGWQPQMRLLVITQMSLLAFVLCVSSMLAYQSAVFEFSGQSAALSWLVLLAFLASLVEQAVGRFLFYLSFERVGI